MDASDLLRETPILLRREDGTVVDLAFREEAADFNRWTIVDFKTDRELGLFRAEYTAQVAYYAQSHREGDQLVSQRDFCSLSKGHQGAMVGAPRGRKVKSL